VIKGDGRMNRKVVSGIMLTLLLASMSTLAFHIQSAKTKLTDSIEAEFEIFGEGQIELTDAPVHSGSYSAKLTIPQGASTSSWASVKVLYGNSLDTLDGFSFYVKYANAVPRFVVYLDTDGDTDVDLLLLSDYLEIGNNVWTLGTGGLRWDWTEAAYPAYVYGWVWEPFTYWKQKYSTATVLFVAVALEYWAVEPDGFGEPLYVDEAIINGETYDIESGTYLAYGATDFSHYPGTSWVGETVLFNATEGYDSYTWDFGDGNWTTLLGPLTSHVYSSTGNYKVTLNVTKYGLWNTTSYQITVTFISDLNNDGTVNIVDVTLVATAYGSKPGDQKWNETADLDKNGTINIIDITMVAKDYGKTV
jgi:hypothetical protein